MTDGNKIYLQIIYFKKSSTRQNFPDLTKEHVEVLLTLREDAGSKDVSWWKNSIQYKYFAGQELLEELRDYTADSRTQKHRILPPCSSRIKYGIEYNTIQYNTIQQTIHMRMSCYYLEAIVYISSLICLSNKGCEGRPQLRAPHV